MQVRTVVPTVSLALGLLFGPSMVHAQYNVVNLVSNQAGVAKITDPLLVNAWGIVHAPGSPWWVSNENSGSSTLYSFNATTAAKVPLNVAVPTASGEGQGTPTGTVFNGSPDFKVQGSSALFLFATLDGTISGWAPSANATAAIVGAHNAAAVYTGLAITSKATGNFLFAADAKGGKVDMYDGSFSLVGSFTDTTLPAGFAPFGIQDFGGLLYVSFAASSGAGGGYIDIFSEGGTLLKQLTNDAHLNQPWGLAVAPRDFGPLSSALLVSNNTNTGTINAYNAVSGQYIGTMKDSNNVDIQINQLWGIGFGDGLGSNGTANHLFFAAGPASGNAGLFGRIELP